MLCVYFILNFRIDGTFFLAFGTNAHGDCASVFNQPFDTANCASASSQIESVCVIRT